jgi:hypothetical protein
VQVSVQLQTHKPQEGCRLDGQGGKAWSRSTIGFKKPRLQPVGSARADADADEFAGSAVQSQKGLDYREWPYCGSRFDGM